MRLFIFLVFNLSLTISTGYADICPICLHEINSGQQSTSLCCGHDFHEDCIKTLRINHRDLSCPVCRQRTPIHLGANSGDHRTCFGEEPLSQALTRPEFQAAMIAALQKGPASPKFLVFAAPFVKSQEHFPARDDISRELYEKLSTLFFHRLSELSEADHSKYEKGLEDLTDFLNVPETGAQ
ncbi:RING finger domain-containing protein [Endozoicomonas sp. 8E]|uniref:RING finger domain-containing protein n=1 Tax=Endozoicomonas sp. 8E TaxID=3035692 RepID=UPI0029392251|nr:RING finger domain-containing protein [Endozoicomonas sp. 8E]WOG27944.1 RING finger domain-containing protein [Endozoicomonas sp. 8E]